MSLSTAIKRAYEIKKERNWDSLYFAIDIHGTILKNHYEGLAEEFYPQSIPTLQYLSSCSEIKLILWSSCRSQDYSTYIDLLKQNNVFVSYFNENPECLDKGFGSFDKKFYFNVLLDDKAGFEPDEDWKMVEEWVRKFRGDF